MEGGLGSWLRAFMSIPLMPYASLLSFVPITIILIPLPFLVPIGGSN